MSFTKICDELQAGMDSVQDELQSYRDPSGSTFSAFAVSAILRCMHAGFVALIAAMYDAKT